MHDILMKFKCAAVFVFLAVFLINIKITMSRSGNLVIPEKKTINKKIYTYIAENNMIAKQGKYANIYYEKVDEQYSDMILDMADLYYPIISSEMNHKISDEKIDIVIYNSKKKFADILLIDEKNSPMGAYYGGFINILNPESWIEKDEDIIERFMNEGPVVHEITHLVLDKKLKGNYDLWFSEGVALYFEKRLTGFEWRKDLSRSADKITYKDLKENFLEIDESLAYRKSYELIDKIGYERLLKILDEIQKGKTCDEFFETL